MGMAVDQGVDAVARQGRVDGGGRHVGDGLELCAIVLLQRLLALLAGRARLRGEGQARGQRLGEEACAPCGVAGLCTEGLIADIIGAQAVAVHQQHGPAVEHHHGGFRQQARTRAPGEVVADQEIAIAVLEEHRHARVGQAAQLAGDEGTDLGRVVVADPGLEQVAEDVQGIGAARLAVDEVAEQAGDLRTLGIEVEVGDEEGGHGAEL